MYSFAITFFERVNFKYIIMDKKRVYTFGNGQRRSVGSEDALGLADLIQFAEGGLLDLHILKSSLNDQIAVSAQVFLQARGDGSNDSVCLFLRHLSI